MLGSDALSGAAGDASCDDAGASQEVAIEGFFGRLRNIPKTHSVVGTPIQAYYGGADAFSVNIGEYGAEFVIWTDVRGMEAMIESLQSVLVRARIAREAVGLPTPARFMIPPPIELDPMDVPF